MFLPDLFIMPLMTIGGKITQGCQPIQCTSHVFPRTLAWTIFLFQTQTAQQLQPCNTVLYSCFLRETSGYLTPLLMFVYTIDNVCRLLTAAQIKFCLFSFFQHPYTMLFLVFNVWHFVNGVCCSSSTKLRCIVGNKCSYFSKESTFHVFP